MKTTRALMGLLIAIIVIFAGVSCAQSAPTASPTPAPSPSPTSIPTTSPPLTPTPQPAQEVTVDLTAENVRFDKSIITVTAGAMVTVRFNNKDSLPHNFALYETSSATNEIFVGEIIRGPETIEYRFKAPETPGTYFFRCDVHPTTMTGDFVVTGP